MAKHAKTVRVQCQVRAVRTSVGDELNRMQFQAGSRRLI